MDLFSLAGRTAVVTGGYGSLGRAITDAFTAAGAVVYATSSKDRRPDPDGRVIPVRLDFRAPDLTAALQALTGRLREDGRTPDILVNNAIIREMEQEAFTEDAFERSIRFNQRALYRLTMAIGALIPSGGSIIQIGSTLGLRGPDRRIYQGTAVPGYLPDYCFNKGALANFTRYAASWFAPRGIRCNAVSPVGIQTERTPPDFARQYAARIPMGRMAVPQDVCGACVFLASDASSFITGVNLAVDGGYTAV